MERKLIHDEVTTIFRTVLEEPAIILNDAMSSRDIEKWDSMNYMHVLTAIENKFGFKFKLKDLTKMKNVGDIISSIEANIK